MTIARLALARTLGAKTFVDAAELVECKGLLRELLAAYDDVVGQGDRLQRELEEANACLSSVRAQRRAWRDEAMVGRAVVKAAKAVFTADGTAEELKALRIAVGVYNAHVVARTHSCADSDSAVDRSSQAK